MADTEVYVPRLKGEYLEKIRAAMKAEFGYTNEMQIPKIDKIVVNMGIGEATADSKKVKTAVKDLAAITGQKPAETKARKSIANFRLREGVAIGCKVTLRGARMYEFLDRLISLALPRVRDFRGLDANSFDGRGNYSLGLSEQLVFPELNPDKFTKVQGMNVTMVISGSNNDESRELLRALGLPFKADDSKDKKGAA